MHLKKKKKTSIKLCKVNNDENNILKNDSLVQIKMDEEGVYTREYLQWKQLKFNYKYKTSEITQTSKYHKIGSLGSANYFFQEMFIFTVSSAPQLCITTRQT